MPNLGLEIKRRCRICGKVFIIKTLDNLYCCKKCSDLAYSRKKRAEAREKQLALIANTKRVTFSEAGCLSIELEWVLVWVSSSSSLYPISIYRFFSLLFSPSSKIRKNFTRYNQGGTKFWWWRHIKRYAVARQRRGLSSFYPSRHAICSC